MRRSYGRDAGGASAIEGRDSALSDAERALVEQRAETARLEYVLEERDKELAKLHNSLSWRVTRPLREIERVGSRVGRQLRRLRIVERLRMKLCKRRAKRLKRQAASKAPRGPLPKPAPKPDIEALKAEYRQKGLDQEPDSFVLYRIIGNDLPPRHKVGQARESLRFILEHEPELPACKKRWVVNRIVDAEEESAIRRLLDDHGQHYLHIPLDSEEYARIAWDFEGLPFPGFLLSKEFEQLSPADKARAIARAYRHKNNYVMNNNGARNAALAEGRTVAKWVLPWDGNSFVTGAAWTAITAAVKERPYLKYFVVPMARLQCNEDLLASNFQPDPTEEPQILFRRDASETFDEAYPYGWRPKVELFWRLGIPGKWSTWRIDPWDLPYPPLAPEAGQFGEAGWVARLFSGIASLEEDNRMSFIQRGRARCDAVLTMLQRLDTQAIARRLVPEQLKTYSEHALARIKEAPDNPEPPMRPVLERLFHDAEEALTRGPYSVVHKTTLPPSGDPHDYWHPAPYWWPNPHTSNGLPYVLRDGQRVPGTHLYEPGNEKYDRTRLQWLFDDTITLALAWYVGGKERYAEHGADLLRHWFLEPETRMNPHLRYAQVRMGHDDNEGANFGIIEMKDLYFFLDGVRLLRRSNALDDASDDGLKRWFNSYLRWLLDSQQGQNECRMDNNHGVLYDLQVASIAAYLNNAAVLAETFCRSHERLSQHFAPDGSQPQELERTNTAHYCCFNLQSWINLARLAQRCGVHLWSRTQYNGCGLRHAMRWFLAQMHDNGWSYQQIEAFDPERLAPLRHAYTTIYDARRQPGTPCRANTCDTKIKLFPHDGVPPYWILAAEAGHSNSLLYERDQTSRLVKKECH